MATLEEKKRAKMSSLGLGLVLAVNVLYCISNKTTQPFTPWKTNKVMAWVTFVGMILAVAVIGYNVQVMKS